MHSSVMTGKAMILALSAAGALGLARGVDNPVIDRGGTFVTLLGRDTVVVESFTRIGNRLDGNLVVRVPGTVLIHYVVDLAADGTPSRSVVDVTPMGTSEVAKRRVTIDYARDSVV